jgi:dTDP-glucose pyrophosphorylase/predicted MFS family arabinose efflux permease
MILWRVCQGLFGSVLMPTSLAILRFAFSGDRLKVAMGLWGAMFALGTAAGPVIAGFVVGQLGWRWVFYLNLIVCACAVTIGARAISERRSAEAPETLDVPGVLALGGTLGALVWAIMRVPVAGWGHPSVLLALAASAASLLLFVLLESRASEPLLNSRLLRSVPLLAGTAVVLFAGLVTFGAAFYLGLYLQQVRGLTPLGAGLTLMPLTVLFVVSAPTGGLLNRRFGPRIPLICGLLLIAVSMLGLSSFSAESSVHTIWPWLLPLGLGVGFVMPTATEVIISNAPASLAGVAGGLQHAAGMVGTVLGTAVFGTLISIRVDTSLSERLARAAVPATTATQVVNVAGGVARGVVPVPPGTPEGMAGAIVTAAHAAFVDGLRTAALVGCMIAIGTITLAARAGHGSVRSQPSTEYLVQRSDTFKIAANTADALTGVILAGGRGTRLTPLTHHTSKQLLPIGGVPLIVRVLHQLRAAGVVDVLLVIDDRHATDFLQTVTDGVSLGLRSVGYVWQPPTGQGLPSAIGQVEHLLRTEKFVVACGDVLLEAGLQRAVTDFTRQPSGARMLAAQVPDTAGQTALEVVGDRVTGLLDKDPSRHVAGHMDLGSYFYHRDVFKLIGSLRPSARGETEIWDLNRCYARRGELWFTEVTGWFADVGASLAAYREVDERYTVDN